MTIQPIILRPDQHEPTLNVIGTQVTVLASNAETQSYEISLRRARKEHVLHRLSGSILNCRAGTTAWCYINGHIQRDEDGLETLHFD